MDSRKHPDGHLWMTALGLSLVFNAALLLIVGLCFEHLDFKIETRLKTQVQEDAVATIYIEPAEAAEEPQTPAESAPKPFARTSDDQPKATEKTNERIGERSTIATSDRPPVADAPPLPSQSGIEPKDGEIETTESRYQDGELVSTPPNPLIPETLPEPPSPAVQTPPAETAANPLPNPATAQDPSESAKPVREPDTSTELTHTEERTPPPRRDTLLEGPNPVEVNVPREVGEAERPKETPRRPADLSSPAKPTDLVTPTPPETRTYQDSLRSFQGNQHKTTLMGSISRTGRSALNVDESELGRYQAVIARAVELEWQRNCVRHRDFITPGFLTVRFCIEPSGKVRTVEFVGDMETGEVQKGFTLTSIREAEIPAMPEQLAKAYEGDALEMVFRFYF